MVTLRRWSLVVAVLGTFLVFGGAGIAEGRCLRYGEPVEGLTGRLEKHVFFGPPGYGESPTIDKREAQGILVLDQPACVEKGARPSDELEVDQLELTLVPSSTTSFAAFTGKHVTVAGKLFHAFTGHHHTKLLVAVSKVSQL